ncbi:MAG: DUF1404 family protein [Candidatus Nitrosocosmicus sp.]
MIGFVILILIYLDESFHEFLESELGEHMIFEHGLFFLLGAMSVLISEKILKISREYSSTKKENHSDLSDKYVIKKGLAVLTAKYSGFLRRLFRFKNIGYLFTLLVISLLFIWHIPSIFDYALLHEEFHRLQHISFIVIGALGFMSLRILGDSYKIFQLFILGTMMGAMGIIFSLLQDPIYSVYSVPSHNYAGTYMLVTGLVILLGFMPYYLIRKTLSYVKSRR